jgi:hypothetical protein
MISSSSFALSNLLFPFSPNLQFVLLPRGPQLHRPSPVTDEAANLMAGCEKGMMQPRPPMKPLAPVTKTCILVLP